MAEGLPWCGLRLAGEEVQLWGERALHWPGGETVFVADPHFGKTAAFRRLGLAAPEDTVADLDRLSRLLEATHARKLVVLGDLIHAREGRSSRLDETVEQWRRQWGEVDAILVRGNHDRSSGDPGAVWGFECVDGPWPVGPFVASHEPCVSELGTVLCGHLHPAYRLRGLRGPSLRSPCFWIRPGCVVLPAFGSFTGGESIQPAPGDRVILAGGERAIEIPVR